MKHPRNYKHPGLVRYFTPVLLGLACLIAPACTRAQDTLTLEQAIKLTLEHNHGIRVAKNNSVIGHNNAKPGNAGLLPTVGLNAGGNYSNNNTELIFAGNLPPVERNGAVSTALNAAVGVSYTIFDGMGTIQQYKRSLVMSESGDLLARFTIEQVLVGVINAYYEAARLTDAYQTGAEALQISRERYRRERNKFELGTVPKVSLLNAQVDLNTDSVTLQNIALSVGTAKRNLNMLMGRSVDTPFELAKDVTYNNTLLMPNLREQALENNAGIRLAQSDMEIAAIDVKMAQAGQYPRVNFNGSYGFNRQNNEAGIILENNTAGLTGGLSLNYNIFDGRRRYTQLQNAKVAVANSKISYDEAILQMERDLLNTYAMYRHYTDMLTVEESNLETARLNYERTRAFFELGQVSSTQFREAQLNLIRARQRLSDTRFSAKLSEIELLRISGQLLT